MSLVLDAGAFLAIERNDRELVALIRAELLEGRVPVTHGAIVGEIWRSGSRQARVARLLRSCDIVPLDESLGRDAGSLLGRSATDDVADAALVCITRDGDTLMTSDPADIEWLSAVADIHVDIVSI